MKNKGSIFSIALVLVLSCNTGSPESQQPKTDEGEIVAEKIYNTHCGLCHGADGRKGLAGAKMLPESQLSVKERIVLITKGKGNMMPYERVLSPEEIEAVANYTLSFK
ncbi:MAG: cytochrome c [Cryomorphaceae bacterium]|nr:cytochrome c [Flavobacteriales bacterium]